MATDTILWTYQDAVDHLLDVFRVDRADTRTYRLALRSVDNAYREIPKAHRWSYLERRYLFQTVASQTTGSIAYDHTGGTNERQLTLTGATWPTDIKGYRVLIDGVHYEIDEYVSSTVVTLESWSNPGADVAASTSYTLYKNAYLLPADFRILGRLWDLTNEHQIEVLPSDLLHAQSTVFYDTPDTPWKAKISRSNDHQGRLVIEFGPPPSAARSYEFLYRSLPRDLKVEKYATGTVTTSTKTVTLTGGTFPEEVAEGTVIRFSTSATEPTSKFGTPADGNNLYYAQRQVVSRTSGTVVTIDEALDADQTSVAYVVSDPIDLEQGAMYTAFLKMCEAEYAELAMLENAMELRGRARLALTHAMESDQRSGTALASPSPYDRFTRVTVTTDS